MEHSSEESVTSLASLKDLNLLYLFREVFSLYLQLFSFLEL